MAHCSALHRSGCREGRCSAGAGCAVCEGKAGRPALPCMPVGLPGPRGASVSPALHAIHGALPCFCPPVGLRGGLCQARACWLQASADAQADYPLPYWPGVIVSHAAMAVFEVCWLTRCDALACRFWTSHAFAPQHIAASLPGALIATAASYDHHSRHRCIDGRTNACADKL